MKTFLIQILLLLLFCILLAVSIGYAAWIGNSDLPLWVKMFLL